MWFSNSSNLLQVLFWLSFLIVLYTYFGYPIALTFLAWIRKPQVAESTEKQPQISMVIAMYNEADHALTKVENCFKNDYPKDNLEVIVLDDGSTDDTMERVIAAAQKLQLPLLRVDPGFCHKDSFFSGLVVVSSDGRHGKAATVNRGVSMARGEIVIFSDADSEISPDAIGLLIRRFTSPWVGCVAGRYVAGSAKHAMGFYWRYENYLRTMESRVGGILGASGTLYAIRRKLFKPIESGAINDDFIIPMRLNAEGYRTLYEPLAHGVEDSSRSESHEFARRVRIMVGNCQHLWLFRGILLKPRLWRTAFQLVSHKLLRVLSPLWLIMVLLTNTALVFSDLGGMFWNYILAWQFGFYFLALIGLFQRDKLRHMTLFCLPHYFVMLNVAAAFGISHFILHGSKVSWTSETSAEHHPVADPLQR